MNGPVSGRDALPRAACHHATEAGMRSSRRRVAAPALGLVILALLAACGPAPRPAAPAAPSQAPAQPAGQAPAAARTDPLAAALTMPLDELHTRAVAEGGTLSFYATIASSSAEIILPQFERRYPGIKVEHLDMSGDKLVARIITEARGGKVLADVFHASIAYLQQLEQQGMLFPQIPAEAAGLPEDLRGHYWITTTQQFVVTGRNTNIVRPEEGPGTYEDLADPRWRGRMIADPGDVDLYMALTRKYQSENRAQDLLRRIAANDPTFHRGHSELAELLAAGQGALCITCYADHVVQRRNRGAPVDYVPTEGFGLLTASSVLKNAPHPYTAMLWQRWVSTLEGQQAYADGNRIPAHPAVTLKENYRPETVYALGPDIIATTKQYENTWKEIFQLR
jgi:iron(III) transport system substrate-binding protein